MKIYGASPVLISSLSGWFRFFFFFFISVRMRVSSYNKRRSGGLGGVRLVRARDSNSVEAPDARNDVLRTPSTLPLIFPPPTWIHKVQPRTSNTCFIPNHIIRARWMRSQMLLLEQQYFQGNGKWWVSEKGEGNCTSEIVDQFVYLNSYGNSVSE